MAALPGQPSGLNNTAYLFGVVAFAFVVFITTRGDLPKWLGLLGLGQSSGTTAAPAPATAAPGASSPGATQGAASVSATGGIGIPALPQLPAIGASLGAGGQ